MNTPSVFTYQVCNLLLLLVRISLQLTTYRQALALAYLPRVDGIFLLDDPQKLVQKGTIARIPFVSGDCDDEGTLFSLSQTNITYIPDFLYIRIALTTE